MLFHSFISFPLPLPFLLFLYNILSHFCPLVSSYHSSFNRCLRHGSQLWDVSNSLAPFLHALAHPVILFVSPILASLVIWHCIGMTKKFFQIKNLNERFDQPSRNKTYTQQSHILHKEKKKKKSGRLLSVVFSYWWSYGDCNLFFSLFCILGIFNRHLSLF